MVNWQGHKKRRTHPADRESACPGLGAPEPQDSNLETSHHPGEDGAGGVVFLRLHPTIWGLGVKPDLAAPQSPDGEVAPSASTGAQPRAAPRPDGEWRKRARGCCCTGELLGDGNLGTLEEGFRGAGTAAERGGCRREAGPEGAGGRLGSTTLASLELSSSPPHPNTLLGV